MLERVRASISRYRMLPDGARAIVAVSGGADSVALLHILREVGANVVGIAHFNHKLRAEESDEDERFVAALASKLDIPFYRREGRSDHGNIEQTARRARRDFFLQLIRDGVGDRVALGHTLDDQAETVLFRILRGSGPSGLAGIHPITEEGFIRPLIDVWRDELRQYLREKGIEWREDSSNADPRFARNRIRSELLPQLRRDWNPKIDTALAQMADLSFEEERYWADRELASTEFQIDVLRTMPRALARRTIRAAIRNAKGNLRGIEFHHVEAILGLVSGRLKIPGLYVTASHGWLRLALSPPPVLEPIEVIVPRTYENAAIRLEFGETAASGCANLKVEVTAPIILRGWKPGDHYHPVGKSRDQKLKEMFQCARIPSWRRPAWPILESEGKILWARRFGAAEGLEPGSGPVLRIWDLAGEPLRLK